MKFIKEEEEERGDYILQKDKKTRFTVKFIIITLIILIAAVVTSGIFFEWY